MFKKRTQEEKRHRIINIVVLVLLMLITDAAIAGMLVGPIQEAATFMEVTTKTDAELDKKYSEYESYKKSLEVQEKNIQENTDKLSKDNLSDKDKEKFENEIQRIKELSRFRAVTTVFAQRALKYSLMIGAVFNIIYLVIYFVISKK